MKKVFPFAILLGALFFYYFITWGSLQNFNQKFDTCESLFCDFIIHYYPTAQSVFESKEPVYGYLYSPFFAILTSPLANLPIESATQIWGIIQIILTLLLFIAPLSTLQLDSLKRQLIYTGIFFTSLPVLHNFKWGQVSALMPLTIIAAWIAHQKGKPIWAGILLGFSTSIKYYPGIFILYFLLKKDKHTVFSFILTCFVLLFLLPIFILGFDGWFNFMNVAIQKLSILSDTISNPNTQYFPYVLIRLLDIDTSRLFVIKALRYFSLGIALFNIVLLWLVNKNKLDSNGLISISLLFCTLPFLIETSWHHYFIFLPFLQISFLLFEGKIWLKILSILSIILSSIFIFNFFPNWESYTKWGFSLFSSLAILISLYLLIFTTLTKGNK